jgi:spermidine/putrescine-binding protein
MKHALDRRDLLTAALASGLGAGVLGRRAFAQDITPLRLWLQSQWWSDEYAAAAERSTKIRIQNTTTVNNPTTFSKLMAGGGRDVDLVQIAGPFVSVLAQNGMLEPVDFAKIPNAGHMFPQFDKPDYTLGSDGKHYGVPFVWGYDSLLYNADHIPESDSFGVLYDEKYKGRIGIRDDAFFGISTAALYLGKRSPFELNVSEIQEVKRFLISRKPVFRTFWNSFSDVVTLMKNRDIWATAAWLPMYWVLSQSEKMNVRYPIPKEGAPGWVACFVIPKGSRTNEANHRFINWMLSAEWAAPIARDKGYYSCARLGITQLEPAVRKALNYDDIEAQMQKLQWSKFPPNLQDWTEAWTEFKAA